MDSAWLKATLRSRRVTQRSLGEAISLSQDKINKALAHVRQFSTIEAIKIADFLERHHVDRSETLHALLGKDAALLEGRAGERKPQPFVANMPGSSRVPVVAFIAASAELRGFAPGMPQETVETPSASSASKSLVALHVKEKIGNAYNAGDLLFYDDHGYVDQSALEKEAIAELQDGRKFLAIAKRGTVPGSYNLGNMENVLLKALSRILWVKKA